MDVEALPPDSTLDVFTAAERPDLWEDARQLFLDVWPEYNQHGKHAATIFGALVPDFAHLQVLLYDRGLHRIVARGRTIPFRWDGTLEDLPAGFDAVGLRALGDRGLPTTLSALAAEIERDQQGRGLHRIVIQAMAVCADAAGLHQLVSPVRPNWKEHHPLVPITSMLAGYETDGLPYDPWMWYMPDWAPPSLPRPGIIPHRSGRLRLGGVDRHQTPG